MHMTWNARFAAILLFITCLLLFSWPLVSIPDEGTGLGTLLYLFFCWAAAIAGLGVYCSNRMKFREKDEEGNKE